MRITIRLFARLRDLAGAAELTRELPDGATLADAWRRLTVDFPGFDAYGPSVSGAVNAEYARMQTPLADGDEVAFLPPVSGGQRRGGGTTAGSRRYV